VKRPKILYFLFLILLSTGFSAIIGGLMFIIKPDGSLMGMETKWLSNSGFPNYLIPGIFLFLFIGVFPMYTFLGLLLKFKSDWIERLNIYKDRYSSWTFYLYSGIILISWIDIQMSLTQFFWLQPVIIAIGLLIIVITMLPSVIKYYTIKKPTNC
jgi:hypothetical protein